MSVRSVVGGANAEQSVQDRRQLGLDHVLAVELGITVGRRAVELVLHPKRDDDLVHEWVSEP